MDKSRGVEYKRKGREWLIMGPGGHRYMEYGVRFNYKETRKPLVKFRHACCIILRNCCYGERIEGGQE